MELQLRNGNVLKYDGAQVMGIINVTPDSFFSGSRCSGEANIRARVSEIIEEGGTIEANCSGKANARIYVLTTTKTKAPGKISGSSPYLK